MHPTFGHNRLLLRILEAFFRQQRLFWVSVIGIFAVVSLALTFRGNSFTATASTRVLSDNKEVTEVLGFAKQTWITPAQSNVDHFADLLKDDTPGGFMDRALKAAQLRQPMNVDPRARDKRYEQFRKKLNVFVDSSEIFSLNLVWDDAAECERILRAIQQEYIEEAGLTKQATTLATTSFLDSQIDDYQRRLQTAEDALTEYKRTHSGTLPEAQTAEIDQLSSLRAERDYLLITSNDNILRQKALEQRLTQIKPTTTQQHLFTVPGSGATQGREGTPDVKATPQPDSPFRAEILALQTRRAAIIARGFAETSTMVRDVDQKISQYQERERERAEADEANAPAVPGAPESVAAQPSIVETKQDNPEYRQVSEQLTQSRIDHTTEMSRLHLLEGKIAEYEKRVESLPAEARELNAKTRDYSILKTQLDSLLDRREKAKIKADLDKVAASSTYKPIGTVYAQPTQSKVKTALMLIGSLIFGLILGFGLIVLAEWMDPTVRYEDDVMRLLSVPALLSIGMASEAPRALPAPPAGGRAPSRLAPARDKKGEGDE